MVYGEEFGQFCWSDAAEQDRFTGWLELGPGARVLDVGCGSGGPSLRMAQLTGCDVTGFDNNAQSAIAAKALAEKEGLSDRATFLSLDAMDKSPWPDASLDAVVCYDTMQHFADRGGLIAEWARLLKPGGRLLFQDPVVITGILSDYEVAVRSSLGDYFFVPESLDEKFLEDAGLKIRIRENGTGSMAEIADRWYDARAGRVESLIEVEGEKRYQMLQEFFGVARAIASEGRLSRIVFLAQKPN